MNNKQVGLVVAVLALLFVINQPAKSAILVHHAFNGLTQAGRSIVRFLNVLADD
jgi:uncharacterized membrane protein